VTGVVIMVTDSYCGNFILIILTVETVITIVIVGAIVTRAEILRHF
jgi:hypothetical protein